MLEATKENVRRLHAPGTLAKLDDQLPQTVQDAIEVTRRLGETYLWCHTLYHVQDDEKHKHFQIARMATIYSQAFLTIVALSGAHAQSKLPGINRGFDGPGRVLNRTEDYFLIPQPSHLAGALCSMPYETRGCTFQERLLSRRCLYFTEQYVYTRCWGGLFFFFFFLNFVGRRAKFRSLTDDDHIWHSKTSPSWEYLKEAEKLQIFRAYGKLVESYT
jgi:hypothetical protein